MTAHTPEKSQLDRFKEAAHRIETDNDEARFNDRLKKIAPTKPPAEPVKK